MVFELNKGIASNGVAVLKKKDGYITRNFKEMSYTLTESVQIGTNLEIKSDNKSVKPHRGQYYLLFVCEFSMAYLFYLDVNQNLRTIYSGVIEDTVYNVYRMIADGMCIKVLQSNRKKAYRVVDENNTVVSFTYKNKSSECIDSVYLNLFDAINYAHNCYRISGKCYKVITPKGTVLFEIGADKC